MKNSALRRGIGALLLPALLVCQRPVSVNPAPVTPFAPDNNVQQVVRLAEAFKATLNGEQVAAVQLPYSKEDAAKWSNFPQAFTRTKRVGVPFGSFNAAQLAAARALLAAVLVFIGAQSFVSDFLLGDAKFPPVASLAVTFGLIATGIAWSLGKTRGAAAQR